MAVDRLARGDDEALGSQCLQADVIGAGGDRALDPRGEELLRLIADYQSRSGVTAETGNVRVDDAVWERGS